MKKISRFLILTNVILLLSYFVWSVYTREQVLKNGTLVLLPLAPVDPRSLIQGDYMRLNYTIANQQEYSQVPDKGYMVIRLDSHAVGHKIRIQKSPQPLDNGELLLKFKSTGKTGIKVAGDSWFFEDGRAGVF